MGCMGRIGPSVLLACVSAFLSLGTRTHSLPSYSHGKSARFGVVQGVHTPTASSSLAGGVVVRPRAPGTSSVRPRARGRGGLPLLFGHHGNSNDGGHGRRHHHDHDHSHDHEFGIRALFNQLNQAWHATQHENVLTRFIQHEKEVAARLLEREKQLAARVNEYTHDMTEKIMKRERIALEHFEHWVGKAWDKTRFMRTTGLKSLAGVAMMMAGTHFGRCVVVFHTVRVTGWPIFSRAMSEVGQSYKRAREAVKSQVGMVRSPPELLRAVRYELASVKKLMKSAQAKLDDGKLDPLEAEEAIRKAQVDIKRLTYEAWILNQAVDSMAAITAALDLHRLKDVLKSVYTGALACVASANSMTVGKLSMTFDLGAILSSDVHYLVQAAFNKMHTSEVAQYWPPETRRFLSAVIGFGSAIKTVLIVNTVLPKMSLRISSSALGAAWVTDAIAELADPHLKDNGWAPIQGHLGYVPIHAGLTMLGYAIQVKYATQSRLPVIIQELLTPLTIAEGQLKKMDKLFKPRSF